MMSRDVTSAWSGCLLTSLWTPPTPACRLSTLCCPRIPRSCWQPSPASLAAYPASRCVGRGAGVGRQAGSVQSSGRQRAQAGRQAPPGRAWCQGRSSAYLRMWTLARSHATSQPPTSRACLPCPALPCPAPPYPALPCPALPASVLQARMLPTLCGIIANPQPHSSILVDGAVEMVTLVLAPSTPEVAAQIHAAATPHMLRLTLHSDDAEILRRWLCGWASGWVGGRAGERAGGFMHVWVGAWWRVRQQGQGGRGGGEGLGGKA